MIVGSVLKDHLRKICAKYASITLYLRILHLAASTLQTDVEAALVGLLDGGHDVTADAVKALVVVTAVPTVKEENRVLREQ